MKSLIIFALIMFASHSALSAPKVRPWLLSHTGRVLFYCIYSVISLVATAGFIWAYIQADQGTVPYSQVPGGRVLALTLMPLVLLLIVGRVTTRTGDADAPLTPYGIYRVCRHPGSVGLLIWTLIHLGNVTENRNLVAFGAMAAIALAALLKNESVRQAAGRNGTSVYLKETSVIPFAAILSGRQHLVVAEIGWWRLAMAAVIYEIILWLHPYLGADPLAPYR